MKKGGKMTAVGFHLIQTLRYASRLTSACPRQIASFPRTCGQPCRFYSIPSGRDDDPKIESLEDLENLLNVPAYGDRGVEFNKALRLEYDFFKYNGQLVPDVMTEGMWEEIRGLKSVEDRLELYRFLQLKERYKLLQLGRTKKGEYAERRKRALLAEIMGGEDKLPATLYDEKGYSLLGPTVSVCRKYDDNMAKKYHNQHLPYALNFGQPLVFDLGVDYQMSNFEGSNFISQMKEVYGSNRSHWEPFNLYLCNYNPRDILHRKLVESNHTEKWLWNVTRRCFTEVFPKEKIVYLCSRSRAPLTTYRHDAVYVIGACVDTRQGKDEMSKVKELGLQHAYFDLKAHFTKKAPTAIPLNLAFRALMDQRDTPNLSYAYRHFPRRLFKYRERAMNWIHVEQEQSFVNKRAIFLPKLHDVRKYELKSCPDFPELSREEDDDDDDDGRRTLEHDRDHHRGQLSMDRKRQRRRFRDALESDDDDFEEDLLTPRRNIIKDY